MLGAFNNVHHERLIHNIRKRKIPVDITRWILSFLSDSKTHMRFNRITISLISTPADIPQRSLLSSPNYIINEPSLAALRQAS